MDIYIYIYYRYILKRMNNFLNLLILVSSVVGILPAQYYLCC